MADLCTADDVKMESVSLVDNDAYDELIESKISDYTIEVFGDAEYTQEELDSITDEDELEQVSYYLKMAIIYRVLMFLENRSIIQGFGNEVSSIRDSQISISYTKSTGNKENIGSYEDQYKKYISGLKPLPPRGGVPIEFRR
jgi:hypothetical protein